MVVYCGRAFFLRIRRPLQFTNSYAFLYIPERFQRYHCYLGLSKHSRQSASKGIHYFMGWNNKMKAMNPVWRPISTKSTSNEDCSLDNIMNEPENIANSVQSEHGKCAVSVGEAVDDSSLQANNEVGVAEGVKVSPGSVSHNSFEVTDAEKVSTVSKEKIAVSVEVGASVMRFIGYKDKSLRESIEEEMGVKLIFPLSKKEDSIVIEGDSMDAITRASEKIQAIIDKAVNSSALTYSHLISLPLAIHNELVDKLTRFQSTVLAYSDSKDADVTTDVDSSDETSEDEEKSEKPVKTPDVAVNLRVDDAHNDKRNTKEIPIVSYAPKTPKSYTGLGIDKSIFIKPKRLHLTVVMLKLWNQERVNAAKEVLQSVSSELIELLDNRPLFIRLKGLDCLRGSPTKAQVLYAPVEEIGNEGRLLRACQIIIDAYVKAGLVLEKDAKQKLKLHATLMNTTHRKGVNRRKHKRRKDSFDATPIFEQFGSEAWGDYPIREAHLSQRFFYDDNGYYHCCVSIPFPEICEVPATSASPAESVEESIAKSM